MVKTTVSPKERANRFTWRQSSFFFLEISFILVPTFFLLSSRGPLLHGVPKGRGKLHRSWEGLRGGLLRVGVRGEFPNGGDVLGGDPQKPYPLPGPERTLTPTLGVTLNLPSIGSPSFFFSHTQKYPATRRALEIDPPGNRH